MRISWEAHETTALSWESREKISASWESHENLMRIQCKHQSPYSEFSWENAQKCSWESRDILMRFSRESVPIFTWKKDSRESHEKLMRNLTRSSWKLENLMRKRSNFHVKTKISWDSHEIWWKAHEILMRIVDNFHFPHENLMRFSWVLMRIFVRGGGHDEQSITMPVTRPKRRAGRDPDGWWSLHSARAQITDQTRLVNSWALLLFWAFIHFEGNWACLVATGSHRYRGQSAQCTALAAELGDRRKENEKEREVEAYLQWKRKDRGQGARRLPRKPRRSVSWSFLQFSSLFGPKVPRLDLLGSLWIFYQRKARRVYSQKPSKRIGYSGIFCYILRLFWRVLLEESEDLTEGLRDDRVREVLQKNLKSLPFPYFNFFFLFFFQNIDERLNEIRRKLRSCTSRSTDFTHVKLKTRSMPFTMYVREFDAAWPNPDLRPLAGRPPVKSKCMGFAGYFARWFTTEIKVGHSIQLLIGMWFCSCACHCYNVAQPQTGGTFLLIRRTESKTYAIETSPWSLLLTFFQTLFLVVLYMCGSFPSQSFTEQEYLAENRLTQRQSLTG